MKGFLLNTNLLSETIRPRPAARVLAWFDSLSDDVAFTSVLVFAEIEQGIAKLPDREATRRAQLEAWLAALRVRLDGRVLPVSDEIATRYGRLSGAALRAGRPLPVLDALLGATAVEHQLYVATRNRRDLALTGAKIFDPFADDPARAPLG